MSLTDLIMIKRKARQPFPEPVALDVILQIARGMLYLHDFGIAHRDLKPQNVIVDNGQHKAFRVKLIDFGLSKTNLQDESNFISFQGCDTTKYRAPEAFPNVSEKVKWFKADVYSFAVTCSAILFLREPFAKVCNGKRACFYRRKAETSS